jgi:hypothetical protein
MLEFCLVGRESCGELTPAHSELDYFYHPHKRMRLTKSVFSHMLSGLKQLAQINEKQFCDML